MSIEGLVGSYCVNGVNHDFTKDSKASVRDGKLFVEGKEIAPFSVITNSKHVEEQASSKAIMARYP